MPSAPFFRSDISATTVLASTAIGNSLANATETAAICTRDFDEIDYSFLIANLGTGPITEFRIRFYFSMSNAPGTFAAAPEDWQPVLADDITTGLSTVDEYTLSCVVASFDNLGSLPASVGATIPDRGLFSLVRIWAEVGVPTDSDFTGSAIRRVKSRS